MLIIHYNNFEKTLIIDLNSGRHKLLFTITNRHPDGPVY
jgi:hypothetical protein